MNQTTQELYGQLSDTFNGYYDNHYERDHFVAYLGKGDGTSDIINPLNTAIREVFYYEKRGGVNQQYGVAVLSDKAGIPYENSATWVDVPIMLAKPAKQKRYYVVGTSGDLEAYDSTGGKNPLERKLASLAGGSIASANLVYAGPTSGGAAMPSFRSLVAGDLSSALASPPNIGLTTAATIYVNSSSGVNGAAGTSRSWNFFSAASWRWSLTASSATESGSNVGSDFSIDRFDDSGSFLDSPLAIVRSSGVANFRVQDAATNGVTNGFIIQHTSTGTTAAGFGLSVQLQGESASGATRSMARLRVTWTTATDASRKAQGILSAYDTAERDCIAWEASGSAGMVGFYGTAPITQQTVTGSRSANAALASLLTALASLGLIVDSSS